MYNVASPTKQQDFESLDQAMAYARALGEFVTITGNGMEIVGVFGADSIRDGKCPDGVDYTWMIPAVGRSSRKIKRKKVDLPEPESPTRKTNSPLTISNETVSSAGRS